MVTRNSDTPRMCQKPDGDAVAHTTRLTTETEFDWKTLVAARMRGQLRCSVADICAQSSE